MTCMDTPIGRRGADYLIPAGTDDTVFGAPMGTR